MQSSHHHALYGYGGHLHSTHFSSATCMGPVNVNEGEHQPSTNSSGREDIVSSLITLSETLCEKAMELNETDNAKGTNHIDLYIYIYIFIYVIYNMYLDLSCICHIDLVRRGHVLQKKTKANQAKPKTAVNKGKGKMVQEDAQASCSQFRSSEVEVDSTVYCTQISLWLINR